MPLNIKDGRIYELVRKLPAATGEMLTKAVRVAIQKRLTRTEARRPGGRRLADRLDEIARHCASLPILRQRTEDEILGYDERGLPDR